MSVAAPDIRALAQEGTEAMRRGESARAREIFQRLTVLSPGDPNGWLALALAARAMGDAAGATDAVEKSRAIDSGNWRTLLLRADLFAEAGDARAASSYYAGAVKRIPAQLAPELHAEADRAHRMRERYANEYENYLRAHLLNAGFGEGTERFAQSLDLMLGKKQLYLQKPRFYYFPELPQIQFYPRAQFPWLDALEAATADIRGELIEVLKDDGAFAPYLEKDPTRPQQDTHGMRGNPSWSAFYLIKNGHVVEENARRCPKTLAAARRAPLASFKDRSPSVLFSLLKAGAHIPPHHGFINVRAICHLGLIVPGKCTFRVGNDVREWEEGKAWVFDDTMEHEATNASDRTRVILLIDVWKPELNESERAMVASMFEAIDAYGGGKQVEWSV